MEHWIRSCPECGKPVLIHDKNMGSRKIICPHCEKIFRFNSDTGELLCDAYREGEQGIMVCPSCKTKHRVQVDDTNIKVHCHKCGSIFYLFGDPKKSVQVKAQGASAGNQAMSAYPENDDVVVVCQTCRTEHLVSGAYLNKWIACKNCGEKIYVSRGQSQVKPQPQRQSTAKPQAQVQAQPGYQTQAQAQPRYQAQTQQVGGVRQLRIRRLMHTHKDLSAQGVWNSLKDAKPVRVFIDKVQQGVIPNGEDLVLTLSQGAHTLGCSGFSSGVSIPADNKDYEALFFNDAFWVGPTEDPFRDRLVQAVLPIFRSQGMKERILDPNNRNHHVRMELRSDGMRLHWAVNQTKGIKQWSTGEEEEMIRFGQLGLTPPPACTLPSTYWYYTQAFLESVILHDKVADLDWVNGLGFGIRTKHDLF